MLRTFATFGLLTLASQIALAGSISSPADFSPNALRYGAAYMGPNYLIAGNGSGTAQSESPSLVANASPVSSSTEALEGASLKSASVPVAAPASRIGPDALVVAPVAVVPAAAPTAVEVATPVAAPTSVAATAPVSAPAAAAAAAPVAAPAVVAIPEPNMLLLFSAAFLGFGFVTRRKK